MVRRRQGSRRPRKGNEIAGMIDDFTDSLDDALDHGVQIAESVERLVDKVSKLVPTEQPETVRRETRFAVNVAMSMTPDAACTILGVPANATMPQITQAYRKAIATCHPDVSNDPKDRKKFMGYHTAYTVLKRRSRFKGQITSMPVAIVEDKETGK